MKSQTFLPTLAALALITLVAFSGIFGRDLWTPDEPRVAAICMEMAQSGDFVVPVLGGQPFIQKPPLGFIVGAGLVQVSAGFLSPTDAVRLSSVLWGFGVLFFTGLLVRDLFANAGLAWQTILVLGSSWGFIESQHWIRVDSALAFFVIAAVWAFAGAWVKNRPWWAIVGGIFTAGAFLTKGPIGPIMVFPAWLALALAYGWPSFKQRKLDSRHAVSHVCSGLVFSLLSASWAILLWSRGGPELFRQWFWENQVVRTTGSSASLGHIHAGEPWYYPGDLLALMLPWSPFLVAWLWTQGKRIWKRQAISQTSVFALIWGLGSIVLLSIPATKRCVYLLPALPVFALMAAIGWEESGEVWKSRYLRFWQLICGASLLLLVLSPLWAGKISDALTPAAAELVSHWGILQLLVLGISVLTGVLIFSKRPSTFEKTFGVTTLLMLAIWIFPARVMDGQKSLRGPVQAFVRSAPPDAWSQTKGLGLSETMRGFFSVYEGLDIPNCSSPQEAKAILEGQNPKYRFLVLTSRSDTELLEGLEWKLVTEGEQAKRRLRLITGIDQDVHPLKLPVGGGRPE